MSKFFSFKGRIARLPCFLNSILLGFCLLIPLIPIFMLMALGDDNPIILSLSILLLSAVGIAYAWASTALVVRRLHDMNVSGWWYLWFTLTVCGIAFIAGFSNPHLSDGQNPLTILANLAQLIFGLILLFNPGTKGPNQYGESPADTEAAQRYVEFNRRGPTLIVPAE